MWLWFLVGLDMKSSNLILTNAIYKLWFGPAGSSSMTRTSPNSLWRRPTLWKWSVLNWNDSSLLRRQTQRTVANANKRNLECVWSFNSHLFDFINFPTPNPPNHMLNFEPWARTCRPSPWNICRWLQNYVVFPQMKLGSLVQSQQMVRRKARRTWSNLWTQSIRRQPQSSHGWLPLMNLQTIDARSCFAAKH